MMARWLHSMVRAPALNDCAVRCGCGPLHCGAVRLRAKHLGPRRALLHTLQQFQFSIVHRAGRDHGNADGLSRVPTSPCGQCTRVDCPPVDTAVEVADQPFDVESVGDSDDAELVPLQSGADWVAQLDDDLSRPASQTGEIFSITALQLLEDTTCITLLEWIRSEVFLPGRK